MHRSDPFNIRSAGVCKQASTCQCQAKDQTPMIQTSTHTIVIITYPSLLRCVAHLLPPMYPPLNVSVHPFGCSFFPIFSNSFGSKRPVSPRSARLTPSLLVISPTPPRIPPLERVPPTPSATPPWMALTFLSPVRSVESLSVKARGLAGCCTQKRNVGEDEVD